MHLRRTLARLAASSPLQLLTPSPRHPAPIIARPLSAIPQPFRLRPAITPIPITTAPPPPPPLALPPPPPPPENRSPLITTRTLTRPPLRLSPTPPLILTNSAG